MSMGLRMAEPRCSGEHRPCPSLINISYKVDHRSRNSEAGSKDSRPTCKMSRKRFVIDGEAVILCVHGISDFDALHSGRRSDESSAPLIFSLKVATICASFRSQ